MAYPPSTTDRTNGQTIDASHINVINDAIDDVVTELGAGPKGASASVTARLSALDTTVSGKASTTHASAHANGGADEVSIDASQVTSGVLDTARLAASGTASGTTYLRGDGAWATPSGSGGGVGQMAITVAAVDAPADVYSRADFQCDGTADQDTINAAFTAALLNGTTNQYGSVELSAGTFSLTGPVLIPGRGAALYGQGIKTELRIATTAATFTTNASGGEGSDKALIMLAATAAARNATNVFISKLSLNAAIWGGTSWTARSGISGIVLNQTAGGSTTAASYTTYGWPTTITAGDTYHRITDLYFANVAYGVRFVDTGGNTYSRGNNVHNVRGYNVSVAGYSAEGASDCHFDQCHCITSSATGAVGFDLNGGNTRVTGCKAAYFDDTSAIGFNVGSSRVSLTGCEAQDCTGGVLITNGDCEITGMRIETQVNPSAYGLTITGAQADNAKISGLYIHRRNTGTITDALILDSGDTHMIEALIDPAGVTDEVVVGGSVITKSSQLPNGHYNIHILGTQDFCRPYQQTYGTVTVNPGATTGDRTVTVNINPGSVSANSSLEITATVTGATTGSPVILIPPSGLAASLAPGQPWVSAADTVKFLIYNTSGSPIDPAAQDWKFLLPAENSVEVSATITGVATGDIVTLVPPSSLESNIWVSQAWVSAANTVKCRVYNSSGADVDPASATWSYTWLDRT